MYERICNDLKDAMKNQDKFKLTTLRMLKSALTYESRTGVNHELSDDEVISIVKRQIKSRKASIEEYTRYNRLDQVADFEKEIELLSSYLPEELSDEELIKVIDSVINEINPTSKKEMGLVIKTVGTRVGAAADMSKVSKIVKEKLDL